MPDSVPDDRLLALLRHLEAIGYRFVTPTPATHARVVARPDRRQGYDLADVLGWSLPYAPGALDAEVERLLDACGVLIGDGERRRATIRVSSLHGRLYIHSAYPTDGTDSVFFGPDSYRFADLVRAELTRLPPQTGARIVDIGTGSGVGAIVAAEACSGARIAMTDINPRALRFARVNAAAAGVEVDAYHADDLTPIADPIDVAIANPPYIIDPDARIYRDGGGMHGGQVSLDMTIMALDRLAPDGRMILYTGSAIVAGRDPLGDALAREAASRGWSIAYRELDPDVFGEELENAPYHDVDRIALVAAIITRRG